MAHLSYTRVRQTQMHTHTFTQTYVHISMPTDMHNRVCAHV